MAKTVRCAFGRKWLKKSVFLVIIDRLVGFLIVLYLIDLYRKGTRHGGLFPAGSILAVSQNFFIK
jgi:hypothetical protein